MFCFSVYQMLVEFCLRYWGGVVSWLWRYKSSIAGSLSWLSEVEHVHISFRVWNLYSTSSTLTEALYGLLAVALYIYHIYYNNTPFALFYHDPPISLSSTSITHLHHDPALSTTIIIIIHHLPSSSSSNIIIIILLIIIHYQSLSSSSSSSS